MIIIRYDRPSHSVDVKGHGGGVKGEDIVCASVSVLVYTLAENAKLLAKDRRFRRTSIAMNSGDAHVSIDAVHGMEAVATLVFDTICAGFELMANEYPDKVSYSCIDWGGL